MRMARVIGTVTLNRKQAELPAGRLVIVDVLDGAALGAWPKVVGRDKPMSESLVVFDELGAGVGQIIAVSEGGEATQPFHPRHVPVDAYCAAIMDEFHLDHAYFAKRQSAKTV